MQSIEFSLNPEFKTITVRFESASNGIFEHILSDSELTNLQTVLSQRSSLISAEKFAKMKSLIDESFTNCDFKKWAEKRAKLETIKNNQLERFHNYYGFSESKLNQFISKIVKKYNSKKYIERERKVTYEPREFLYDFLLSYARKNCKPNYQMLREMFSEESYDIGKYNITLYCGQGSYIRICKLKDIENQ